MRWLRWFLLGFLIVAVPAVGLRAYSALHQLDAINQTRASIKDNSSQLLAAIQDARIHKVQTRALAALLTRANATASFTGIQALLDGYLDQLARAEHIGIGASTCDSNVTENVRPGLEGVRCTLVSTGRWTRVLDATNRLASYAPVVIDVSELSLQRNTVGDASTDPELAATTTMYIERVEPVSTPVPTPTPATGATPSPSAAPTASGAPT